MISKNIILLSFFMFISVIIMAVPANELRTYMLAAYDQNMVAGDYVFFEIDNLFEAGWTKWNETWADGHDGRDEEARKAAENLIIVSHLRFTISEFQFWNCLWMLEKIQTLKLLIQQIQMFSFGLFLIILEAIINW